MRPVESTHQLGRIGAAAAGLVAAAAVYARPVVAPSPARSLASDLRRPWESLSRMIRVPSGEHVVELTLRQPTFHLGLGVTIATAIGAPLIALGPFARTRISRPR